MTVLGEGQWTPAPWINVSPTRASASRSRSRAPGYTWSVNSRENQLTPWSNDPVSDPPGEAIYVRDEETGELWGPTRAADPRGRVALRRPARAGLQPLRAHLARHRARAAAVRARSTTRSRSRGSTIENRSGQARRLSVTAYVEWVLGASRSADGAVSSSPRSTRPPGRCWRATPGTPTSRAASRSPTSAARQTAWTGRPRGVPRPQRHARPSRGARARRPRSSGRVGAGLDPCAALQAASSWPPGAPGRDRLPARPGRHRWRRRARSSRATAPRIVDARPDGRRRRSGTTSLGAVQVKTPDRVHGPAAEPLAALPDARLPRLGALGLLPGGRRLRLPRPAPGRDGARRSRGARSRASTCCAPRPGSSSRATSSTGGIRRPARGVRTRISDDLAVAALRGHATTSRSPATRPCSTRWCRSSRARRSRPGRTSRTSSPARPTRRGTLFEHCARALDRSLAVGAPRPAADGHRRLERRHEPRRARGRGRERLARLVPARDPLGVRAVWPRRAASTRAPSAGARHVGALKTALERDAWDGDWYRRAYFDDGTPLGSAVERRVPHRLDRPVLGGHLGRGATRRARARAMAAVEEYLVRRGDGLVLLFTPPFDRTPLDPGYIKGYLPGVRENGGQYTHAAIWAVIAFAALGDGDQAGELFAILNPINHTSTPRGRPPLQGRALRGRRRRLRRAAARRARRLDLVHRLGRLDVPRRHRVDPRLPPARRDALSRPVHPARVAAASRSRSATTPRATRSRSRTRRA